MRGGKEDATIRPGTLTEFASGGTVEVVPYTICDPPSRVLERASVALGSSGYDLFQNNCEHFATWCKTGRHESRQVKRLLAAIGTAFVASTGIAFYNSWRKGQKTPRAAASARGRETREALCKAETARGTRCRNGALAGNYGFCGVHRR